MTKRTWPSVTNRNVAQPSRVRLVNAPDAGSDVFDVIPVPGTVTDEGTLLNKALFDSEKAYIDQNDIPFVTTAGTGAAYTANVPQWSGMTKSELHGKLLLIFIHTVSTTNSPTIDINGLGSWRLYTTSGQFANGASEFPSAEFMRPNRAALLKLDYNATSATIISSIGRTYGGSFTAYPWDIGAGGTGRTTANGASNAILGKMTVSSTTNIDASQFTFKYTNPDDTNGALYARPANLVASWVVEKARAGLGFNTNKVLGIANGGTGGNTLSTATAALQVQTLGSNCTPIDANADLNAYKTLGNFYCINDATARTLLNTPWGTAAPSTAIAFKMTVEHILSSLYAVQTLKTYGSTRAIWQRATVNGGTSWSAWRPIGNYSAGTGISISSMGVISATGAGYTLPVASTSTLGGIKVGSGLSMAADGTLSAVSGGGGVTFPITVAQGGTGGNTATLATKNLGVAQSWIIPDNIAANTDLNTITAYGTYGCHTNNNARTILNLPYGKGDARNVAFKLVASTDISTGYLQQTLYYFSKTDSEIIPGEVWKRCYAVSSKAWGSWYLRQLNYRRPNALSSVLDYNNYYGIDSNFLAYWDGSWSAGSHIGSNLKRLGTVDKGIWNATPIAVQFGGTSANTAAGARANLGVPALTAVGNNFMLTKADGSKITTLLVGDSKALGSSAIVPAVPNAFSLGTRNEPWDYVYADNLVGSVDPNQLKTSVPIRMGGTGASSAANAKANLGMSANTGYAATGSDAQIKECYRICDSLYYVRAQVNLKATSATGLVNVGSLTLPFNMHTQASGSTLIGVVQVRTASVSTGGYVSLAYGAANRIDINTYAGGPTKAKTDTLALLINVPA